jgi:hypothetical protein
MLMMLIVLITRFGFSQDFELDTREVLDVIKKWNYANNAMSEQSFRDIYADRLIFYSQNLPREKCIALKKSLFAKDPGFKQKIISDPVFTAYTGGVIKADFTKEVFQKGKWKQFPSYLLITYENNRYLISGESDLDTDKKLKYKLDIGVPMDIPQSEVRDTTQVDSVTVASDDSVDEQLLQRLEDSTLISSVTQEVLSNETVAVPKRYVYLLIALLIVAATVVLFSRRPKRSSRKSAETVSAQKETQLIRNEKGFENFVVALFDPHYFTLKTLTRQRVYAGNARGQDFVPSLEFEFQNKDTRVRLAIETIFIPQLKSREILSYSANQINRYHEFEDGTGMEVYLIVGLEGDPADPKELYLIPTSELREGYMGYQELQPFRKYGMFFYNTTRRRLL